MTNTKHNQYTQNELKELCLELTKYYETEEYNELLDTLFNIQCAFNFKKYVRSYSFDSFEDIHYTVYCEGFKDGIVNKESLKVSIVGHERRIEKLKGLVDKLKTLIPIHEERIRKLKTQAGLSEITGHFVPAK